MSRRARIRTKKKSSGEASTYYELTFDQEDQFALGELGMREVEFLEMTPRAFYNLRIGYQRRLEREYRQQLEHARIISYHAIAPHLKASIESIYDFMPFPWDDHDGSQVIRSEKVAKVMKEFWDKEDAKKALEQNNE